MQTLCLYCWQTLSFDQSVKGQLFCSPEHRESYLEGQILLNFGRPDEAPAMAGLIRSNLMIEKTPQESPDVKARRIQTASRILQSLDSRKLELPSMPAAIVPAPKLVPAAPVELHSIHPSTMEPRISATPESHPPDLLRPAQLDPMVRFAARIGGFGPFKPQRSIRPWAFSALAAGITLAALFWGPYGTGGRSLVTRVSAAERQVPAANLNPAIEASRVAGCTGSGKNRGVVIDGHSIGPVRPVEFPRVALVNASRTCGNPQLALSGQSRVGKPIFPGL